MKKFLFAAALVAGCSGNAGPVVAPAVVATQLLGQTQQLTDICNRGAPILGALSTSTNPKVVGTVAYPAEYCRQLTSTGILPPTTDSNTLSWLPGAIKLAAQVAGIVIPLL